MHLFTQHSIISLYIPNAKKSTIASHRLSILIAASLLATLSFGQGNCVLTLPFQDTMYVQCYGQDSHWSVPQFDADDVTVQCNCANPVTTFHQNIYSSADCAADGFIARYELIWTVKDNCSDYLTDTAYMVLIDTIAPQIHGVPADITISGNDIPAAPEVTTTDECLCACVMQLAESPMPGGCLEGTILTRTWTAMDQCGNASYATQRITIMDNTGPSFLLDLPHQLVVHNNDTLKYACEHGGLPSFLDDLDIHGMIVTDPSGVSSVAFHRDTLINNNCEFFGFLQQQVFQWTATDSCGHTSNFQFVVRLSDAENPHIFGAPDTTCMNDPLLELVEAVDDCSNVGLTYWDVPTTNPCGTGTAMRRTYEAIDACGNMVRDTVILLSDDNLQPVMKFINPDLASHLSGDTIVAECSRSTGSYTGFNRYDVSVQDSCIQGVHVDYSEHFIADGNCATGTTAWVELRWMATDYCGNFSTMNVVVNVQDHTPPAMVNFKNDIIIGCSDDVPDVAFTDNCGSVTVVNQDSIIQVRV